MTSSTTQPQFDFRIATRRPLWPMKAAMVFLDRHEDDVLALIASAQVRPGLRFAFNAARPGRKVYALVWRGSALEYKSAISSEAKVEKERDGELDSVIDDILPRRPSLRGVELQHLFSVSQRHIANLIADGLMTVDRTRPVAVGRGESPWVLRASVAEFLKQRRM